MTLEFSGLSIFIMIAIACVVVALIVMNIIRYRGRKNFEKLAEEIKRNEEESNKLGLTVEEKAFYDALSSPEGIREAYTDEQFVALTRELTEQLRRNRTIDWNRKESARAKMRVLVKRLLKKYKYPPEGQEKALETVMAQYNKWADDDDNVVAEPETHEIHMYPRIEEESEMMMAAESENNYNE